MQERGCKFKIRLIFFLELHSNVFWNRSVRAIFVGAVISSHWYLYLVTNNELANLELMASFLFWAQSWAHPDMGLVMVFPSHGPNFVSELILIDTYINSLGSSTDLRSVWHLTCAETWNALQRQNAENLKQIFPEKEYRGLSPNFHIHVSVSGLYIPTMGLPFLLEEICGPILGIHKSLTDTWMWKLGLRPRYSQKRNI